ncbi:hypothetical protein [Paraburkholderia graminis]|uniref:hypothetical protein n=1 Tax=Paraburkholderia graminis TaxID=60548 RepID=UPI0038BBCBDA
MTEELKDAEIEAFEIWASDYGFHAGLLDVHQYALEAARDAWQARAALTLTDEQRNLIKTAAECIAESVTFEQDGFDTPPMPATEWDYNADQLAYALRAMLEDGDKP